MTEIKLAPAIVTEIRGSLALVTFNRPDARNSLSSDVLNSLDALLQELLTDHKVQTIVFTGAGNTFLAGADIRELARLDPKAARGFSQKGQRIFARIANAPQTTIAAINGYCMGGGLDFALACDIRVASSTTVFAHPGARLGIITGWGGTQRLPRIIGKSRALEFFVTARQLPVTEALKFGLITEICDPVVDGAVALASRLITTSSERT